MKCNTCGHDLPDDDDTHQKYIEAQAKNMYTVWMSAMNSYQGINTPYTWEETGERTKQVWYAVTAAALMMHKF